MTRHKKGTVVVDSREGMLRLRLPRQVYGGQQKYLSLGIPDTDINRKAADAKAKTIELDILFNKFDPTLAKYGNKVHDISSGLTLEKLFDQYNELPRLSFG